MHFSHPFAFKGLMQVTPPFPRVEISLSAQCLGNTQFYLRTFPNTDGKGVSASAPSCPEKKESYCSFRGQVSHKTIRITTGLQQHLGIIITIASMSQIQIETCFIQEQTRTQITLIKYLPPASFILEISSISKAKLYLPVYPSKNLLADGLPAICANLTKTHYSRAGTRI